MNRAALPVSFLCALAFAVGCKDSKKEPASEASSGPPKPASRALERDPQAGYQGRRLQQQPVIAGAPLADEAALTPAQLKVSGELNAPDVKAESVLLYLSKAPCDLSAEKVEHFGSTSITFKDKQLFLIGVQVPPRATGHLCAVGLDANRAAVAEGAYEKNPLQAGESGPLVVEKVQLTLRPLKGAKPLPKGL